MSLLGWLAGGAVGLYILNDAKKSRAAAAEKEEARKAEKEEENRRKSTPCYFSERTSESEFTAIVKKETRKIKRICNLSVKGPIVDGTVRSQSGVSEWNFTIDFNDYGEVTGRYWLTSDNDDSNVPQIAANLIRDAVISFQNSFFEDSDQCSRNESSANKGKSFCPYCGAKIDLPDAKFCGFCGERL